MRPVVTGAQQSRFWWEWWVVGSDYCSCHWVAKSAGGSESACPAGSLLVGAKGKDQTQRSKSIMESIRRKRSMRSWLVHLSLQPNAGGAPTAQRATLHATQRATLNSLCLQYQVLDFQHFPWEIHLQPNTGKQSALELESLVSAAKCCYGLEISKKPGPVFQELNTHKWSQLCF